MMAKNHETNILFKKPHKTKYESSNHYMTQQRSVRKHAKMSSQVTKLFEIKYHFNSRYCDDPAYPSLWVDIARGVGS